MLQLVPLLHAGQYVEIERRARSLIERDPLCGGAWKALGVSIELQNRDSIPALQRAAQLLPDDAEVHASLGAALLRAGRGADAIGSLRRALEIRPDDPDLHSNLGNALRSFGQWQEALESYRRAVHLAPGRPELHGNIAYALWHLNRPAEAAESFRRALALKPGQSDLLAGLAMALVALGRSEEALVPVQRALELAPQSPEVLNTFGNVLLDLGRDVEAEGRFREAVAQRPEFVEALGNLAIALRLQGKAEQAIEAASRALQVDPRFAPTLVALADALADHGDFEQAEQRLREALAIDPDSAQACAGLAHLRRMTARDAPWLAQASRIAAHGDLPPRMQIQLQYAIGKYYDDLQQYDDAFGHYRLANELSKRNRSPYEPAQWEREVDRLIREQDRDWMRRSATRGLQSTRPVFVVGMPRSGTSLIEQILATHPAVFGAGELPFWDLAAARIGASGSRQVDAEIGQLGGAYLEQLETLSAEAARVVDKAPDNFRHLGLIHAALPQARIIHVRRQPLDNCLSIYFQDFRTAHAYSTDLGNLAHYYRHYRRLMQHWRSLLPASALLEISYESLIGDQEAETRKLLDFLDLRWEPRCLEFQKTRRNVATASRWQVRQRISAASVGRWRHYERYLDVLLPLLELEDSGEIGSRASS